MQLNRIAGNSIAIPVVASIMAVLLAATELIQPSESQSKGVLDSKAFFLPGHRGSMWVGLNRVADNAGEHDCLLKAGKKRSAPVVSEDGTLRRFVKQKV